MERLMRGRRFASIHDGTVLLRWFMQQGLATVSRIFGIWDWCLLGVFVLSGCLLVMLNLQQRQAHIWESRLSNTQPAPEMHFASAPAKVQDNDRQRLLAFEKLLLPHEDIPVVVESLLRAAEESGLSIRRAEYKAQPDVRGRFLRYRISLPVQGAAENVNQYLYKALLNQENLALDSVQLKRNNLNSPDLEARIQWSVLTRLPAETENLP